MEGILVIATVAQRWRLRLIPGHPVEPQTLVVLRPRYGMRMRLERHRRSSGVSRLDAAAASCSRGLAVGHRPWRSDHPAPETFAER